MTIDAIASPFTAHGFTPIALHAEVTFDYAQSIVIHRHGQAFLDRLYTLPSINLVTLQQAPDHLKMLVTFDVSRLEATTARDVRAKIDEALADLRLKETD